MWSGGGGGGGVDGKKWKAEYDPKFERQYRSLGREAAKRVNTAIDDTVVAEGVGMPGTAREGFLLAAQWHSFARSVGRSYRILYCIRGDSIRFLRVGDHKEAYGKD